MKKEILNRVFKYTTIKVWVDDYVAYYNMKFDNPLKNKEMNLNNDNN